MKSAVEDSQSSRLLDGLPLSLSDLGYEVARVQRRFPDPRRGESRSDDTVSSETIFDYYQITCDEMLIPDRVVEKLRALWIRGSPLRY